MHNFFTLADREGKQHKGSLELLFNSCFALRYQVNNVLFGNILRRSHFPIGQEEKHCIAANVFFLFHCVLHDLEGRLEGTLEVGFTDSLQVVNSVY